MALRFSGAAGFGGGTQAACLHASFERVDWGAVCASMQPALAESIGIAAALVQAKDAAVKAWYLGQAEWLKVTAGGRTFWLPVGVVVGA
jgi:hypothetical protein